MDDEKEKGCSNNNNELLSGKVNKKKEESENECNSNTLELSSSDPTIENSEKYSNILELSSSDSNISTSFNDREELYTLSETEMLSKYLNSYCFSNFTSFPSFEDTIKDAISNLLSFFKLPLKYFNIKVDIEQLCADLLEYIGKGTETLKTFYKNYIYNDMCEFLKDFSSQYSPELKTITSTIFTINIKENIEEKDKEEKNLGTETINIPYSKELSRICHLSKNLYNHANWLYRMRYYFLLKPTRNDLPLNKIYADLWNRWVNEPEFSIYEILSEFKQRVNNYIEKLNKQTGRQNYHSIDPDELMDRFGIDKKLVEYTFKNKDEQDAYYRVGQLMSYRELWDMVYYSPEFQAFGGQKGQQTLKLLERNWKSYFEVKKIYDAEKKKNLRSDISKPSIPSYLKKNGEFIVVFPHQSIYKIGEIISKRKNNGKSKTLSIIGFSPKKLNLPSFKTTIPFELIRQVIIVPKGNIYTITINYKKEKQINYNLDKNRVVGGDFGGINLLSVANNFGDRPRIIKGGDVRFANYITECQVSQLVSNRDDLINSLVKLKKEDCNLYKTDIEKFQKAIDELDKKINPIWTRRNNRVKNALHQASRLFVDYCIEYRAETIVLGYNDLWKQTMRMGKKTRKWFNTIPFYTLYKMIEYKANLVGINVIKVPEFKEDESGKIKGSSKTCCRCDKEGRRVKRGLFHCPHCGLVVNSDVNGAYNHLEWGMEGALNNYTKQLFERPPIPLFKSFNNFNRPRALA